MSRLRLDLGIEVAVLRAIGLQIVLLSHEHRIGPSIRGFSDEEDKASQRLGGREAEWVLHPTLHS